MIPATIRNHNAGGMYPGKCATKYGATTFEILNSKDGVHKIATFPSAIHGAAAMFELLRTQYTGRTFEAAIKKWCGNIHLASYLKVLESRVGIKPTDMLTEAYLRDHETAIPLAKAMAWQEAGREYPLSDQEWLSAHALCFAGGAVAPSWAPTNDLPTPKAETRAQSAFDSVKGKAAAALGIGATGPVASVPTPPDLSAVSAWQSAVTMGQSLMSWGLSNWKVLAAGAAVYALLAHVAPYIGRKLT